MTARTLILGTRGSLLARTQSQLVADMITDRTGVPVELKIISTKGDRIQDKPLALLGGKGLFTFELEEGLRDGSIDFAVHSLKDLPTDDADGLILGAIPEREDPRDAVVGATLDSLKPGAIVGTGSLRRHAQVAEKYPGLEIRDIRGNVDTRLGKRDAGTYDVIILAMAGMIRLGIERDDAHPLAKDWMIPAVGQGALAVQCRAADPEVRGILSAIDHAPTRRCVDAERAFLAAYGGGCNVPAACHAVVEGDLLHVTAAAVDADGALKRVEARGVDGPALGRLLAGQLK